MKLAPLILFTYNRPAHLRRTIDSLLANSLADQTDLVVFSDAARNEKDKTKVELVREYLLTVSQFKSVTIIERQYNFGLGKNVIEGVTEMVLKYGKVIVMEDDLIASPYFLEYMNNALDIYAEDDKVISIHGYVYPVKENLAETFFIRGADCLGWGTWKRAWNIFESDGKTLLKKLMETGQTFSFDFNNSYPYTRMLKEQIEGKNNSWAVRWYASAFLNDKYTLYPGRSLIHHAGGDGTGVNTGYDNHLDVVISSIPVKVSKISIEQNVDAYNAFVQFYKRVSKPSILYRLKRKFKTIFDLSPDK